MRAPLWPLRLLEAKGVVFAWTGPDFQEVLGASGGGLLTGALFDEGEDAASRGAGRLAPARDQQGEVPRAPPGHYRFEVRARGQGGAWGPLLGFDLEVHPPWWGTVWGRLLSVLLLGAGVAGMMHWRARRLRRGNAGLEALVLARTTELGRARERVAQAEKLSAMGQLLARLSH
ncbi:hypothetical protein [Archangium sp.]|uniref:hypothetical protein n=1 Tax=Archangium sp. TaxID=1872627 RepID=UPI002D373E61|nr:hypothetical protein [Archangium sp.]HYO54620.1 hypothetical protein [Archangium sp.]